MATPKTPIRSATPTLRALAAVAFVAACAGSAAGPRGGDAADDNDGFGRERPPTIVKRAPVDVRAMVEGAPTTAGVDSGDGGDSGDSGAANEAADVVAAFNGAGLTAAADPHIGRFLRAIFFMVVQDQQPSGLLAADMAERLGVGGPLSHSFLIPAADRAQLAAEVKKIAAALPPGARVRVGVSRESIEGEPALFVGVVPAPVTLARFERKGAAGATVKLTGTWHEPDRSLKLYVDGDDGGAVSDDVVVGEGGAFSVPVTLRKAPGVVRLELVSVDDGEMERDVYSAAFYVGAVPGLGDGVDDATPVTAAGVLDVVNRLRASQQQNALERSVLLDGAIAHRATSAAALRAHLARSGFLVRHPLSQTFGGLLTLAEFERMTTTSPWVRSMSGRATANQLGVVVRQDELGSTVELFTAEVSSAIDPAREARRAVDGVNRSRARAGQKPLVVDAAVESKLQGHVARICRGEVAADDQGALQIAVDPALRQRRFQSLATFTASGDDIPGSSWARNFKEVTSADYNTVAVGACNGAHAVAGEKNAVLLVLLLGRR